MGGQQSRFFALCPGVRQRQPRRDEKVLNRHPSDFVLFQDVAATQIAAYIILYVQCVAQFVYVPPYPPILFRAKFTTFLSNSPTKIRNLLKTNLHELVSRKTVDAIFRQNMLTYTQ